MRSRGGVGVLDRAPRCRRTSPAGGLERRRAGSGPRARSSISSSTREARPRALGHRRRDGLVERDHGVVRDLLEQPVEREDLRPVGVLGAGAWSWTAAIAACSRYSPDAARCPAPRRAARRPRRRAPRSQTVRSCSASGTSSPPRVGSGGPPGVDQQHQREQAVDLARRRAAIRCSIRVRRIASSESSARCSSRRRWLA